MQARRDRLGSGPASGLAVAVLMTPGRAGRGGRAIVLVHGLVIASRYMRPLLAVSAALGPTYAPELPGYGRSDKPAVILTLPQLADTLGAWMDAASLPRAHFIGNSFGCQVLTEFAVRHPARVDRLVLQGPTIDPQARTLRQQLLRLAENSRRESPGLGWIMLTDYWRAGLRRVAATVRMALEDRIEDRLPRIQAPTLVVRGTLDPLVPQSWAEQVVALLPRGSLAVIPGAAHTINYTHPTELVALAASFFSDAEASSRPATVPVAS